MGTRELLEFWCYSQDSILELFEKFQHVIPVNEADVTQDCENVWEWIEGESADRQVGFNICRPHQDLDDLGIETRADPDAPVRLSLSVESKAGMSERLGSSLASALQVEVFFGEVEYLQGDEFEYRPAQVFKPI